MFLIGVFNGVDCRLTTKRDYFHEDKIKIHVTRTYTRIKNTKRIAICLTVQ